MAIALGLAILAGALGLASMLASRNAPDGAPLRAGSALAAPLPASLSGRDRHRLQARVSDPAPQATAIPQPAVGGADARTTEVWERTGVSFWHSLVASEPRDGRAFLLATAFQRWIPPPLLVAPRSPVVLPSKEG